MALKPHDIQVIRAFSGSSPGSGGGGGGYTPPVTTAENDFQVGGPGASWVKKTLGEVQALINPTTIDGGDADNA